MCLQFGSIIFWQKDFGAKAAHKMLVKLTPGGDEERGLWTISITFNNFKVNFGVQLMFVVS